MLVKIFSRSSSASRISSLKNSITPRKRFLKEIGNANAPRRPSAAAIGARGRLLSLLRSEIHSGLRLVQIRTVKPTPGANVRREDVVLNPTNLPGWHSKTVRQRRTPAFGSGVQNAPTSHARVSHTVCRILGTASVSPG